MSPETADLLFDTRLSEMSRVLGAYVGSLPEWTEIAFDDPSAQHAFVRVLKGAPSRDTIRRHLRELRVYGRLESRPGGGGHAELYRLKPLTCAQSLGDRMGTGKGLPNRVGTDTGLPDSMGNGAHPTPGSVGNGAYPSPAVGGGFMGGASPRTNEQTDERRAGGEIDAGTAGTGEELPAPPGKAEAVLRAHLGAFAVVVAPFLGLSPPDRREMVAYAVLGKFGPTGAQRHFWRGVPPEEEPAILAATLLNYVTDPPKGHATPPPYVARLFEEYLRRARDTSAESRHALLAAASSSQGADAGRSRAVTTRMELPAALLPWAVRVDAALRAALDGGEAVALREWVATMERGVRQAWSTDQRWGRWGTDFQGDVVWVRVLGKYGERIGDPAPGPLPP